MRQGAMQPGKVRTTQQEIDDLKETTRLAHVAIKDLRGAIKDAVLVKKEVHAYWHTFRDASHKELAEQHVTKALDTIMEDLDVRICEAAEGATKKVVAQIDKTAEMIKNAADGQDEYKVTIREAVSIFASVSAKVLSEARSINGVNTVVEEMVDVLERLQLAIDKAKKREDAISPR